MIDRCRQRGQQGCVGCDRGIGGCGCPRRVRGKCDISAGDRALLWEIVLSSSAPLSAASGGGKGPKAQDPGGPTAERPISINAKERGHVGYPLGKRRKGKKKKRKKKERKALRLCPAGVLVLSLEPLVAVCIKYPRPGGDVYRYDAIERMVPSMNHDLQMAYQCYRSRGKSFDAAAQPRRLTYCTPQSPSSRL
ncbi:hypothetical protein MAPG_06554 [Magnaporthiopsis poae ATCC 64411]|uniref:Uncharacterized protein n=1 Tax=Magnaporthiopsis poae (strain ATCC 64411 / 73-15) TaxID=644358 RepID=A0A0C4E2C3_MAGP6|nr:hypothetical protein MAPG_06554 [Magnaporthiopsis poae ATCC 64411]